MDLKLIDQPTLERRLMKMRFTSVLEKREVNDMLTVQYHKHPETGQVLAVTETETDPDTEEPVITCYSY